MMVAMEQINGILSASLLMLCGALIIFIYDAYCKTKQKTLLLLAVGLFILITGSALSSFLLALTCGISQVSQLKMFVINPLLIETISLSIQVSGILIVIYSALKG